MDPSLLLYAAYGSNLHPRRLRMRLPHARFVDTGMLSGWSLSFNKRSFDRSGKCCIRQGDGDVHVAVYELTPADKDILDRIEGVGFGYRVESVAVPGCGTCFYYMVDDEYIDPAIEPYDWYRQIVELGCRYHGFPQDYLNAITSVRARRDPDAERRLERWRTVDTLRNDLPCRRSQAVE